VSSPETAQLRALGAKLALYIRRGDRPPSTAALQAVVADLTAATPELTPPLRDLVGRVSFQALIPLAAQGSGSVQRDALIQEVRRIYTPEVVASLQEILNGFLECSGPAKRTASANPVKPEPPTASKRVHPANERPSKAPTSRKPTGPSDSQPQRGLAHGLLSLWTYLVIALAPFWVGHLRGAPYHPGVVGCSLFLMALCFWDWRSGRGAAESRDGITRRGGGHRHR
jgi:hypothetical protein